MKNKIRNRIKKIQIQTKQHNEKTNKKKIGSYSTLKGETNTLLHYYNIISQADLGIFLVSSRKAEI